MLRPYMTTDSRRLRVGVPFAVLAAVSFVGCGGVIEPTVAARTDAFVITDGELAAWTPFLEGKRELRDRLRKAEDPRQELLRTIAMIRLVPPEYGALVPGGELEAAERDLEYRQIRATYLAAVLKPRIEVTDDEIRQIFSEHRQNYQKAEAVQVLEIFKWAPRDLPELRQRRSAELESLKTRIESSGDFETAALERSDATSAYKEGRIGALYRDRVSGPLEAALFNARVGLTEVVASDEGLHLFYIIDRLPPRSNDLSDVTDEI